jgi:hypothetical protein
MGDAPLDEARIGAIRASLDAGDLERAERLLSALDPASAALPVTRYLALRLRYESGTIEADTVTAELEGLVEERPDFTDAVRMLHAAQSGGLVRRTVRSPPPDLTQRASRGAAPTDHARRTSDTPRPNAGQSQRSLAEPRIPRAPMVPVFGPPSDSRPSYVPEPPPATHRDPTASGRMVAPDPSDSAEAPSADPEVYRPRRGATQPTRMRSGRPPELNPDGAQSLLAIATLLDEGMYAQALSALDRAGANAGPEFTLMRARALHGAERDGDAQVLLERLCSSESLPADVRAGCARLLIDLGQVDRALNQAEIAYRDRPHAPVTTQTLVWALCRGSWERPDLVDRIPALLESIDSDRGPRRALGQSLRAYVACTLGGAEHGAEAAEAALDLDPKSRDALLALAIAWARLGDPQRAAHFIQRFASQHPGADRVARGVVAHWVERDRARSR